MQLSSQQFEKILSALRSDSPASGTKDKRRRPRVGLRASITLIETADGGKGTRVAATIRDVSREGIGIQRSVMMKTGQRFVVQLPSNEGAPQTILCTVRHSKAVADAAFHIGATFIRVCSLPSKEDTQILNADAAEAKALQETVVKPRRQPVRAAPRLTDEARIQSAILS